MAITRKLPWLAALALIIAGAGWWYFGKGGKQKADNTFERTAVARRGDLVVSISASGRIDPVEKVEVKSKASGEIIDLPIEEGDFVKKGDLIARLDRTYAQNDYDQAQADFAVGEITQRQREREHKRMQALFEGKLASETELDNARLAFEQANAQMVRARAVLSTTAERLRDTEIRAPIDGLVLSRPVEIGQIISSGTTTVTGGTLLCTVANMTEVYVVADVDETDIGRVEVGLPAQISPDAFADRKLEGTVLRVAPLSKVEQNVTVFEVTTLVENTGHLLKAGMNATVEVIIDQAKDALLIPAQAVEWRSPENNPTADTGEQRGGGLRAQGARADSGARHSGQRGGPKAMVQVVRNGLAEWKPVKTGLSNLDEIEVREGIAEGDTVVYSLASSAMRDREQLRERMRDMQSMPGMRKTN